MALIRCPDCNRLVSSKAAVCPRCARPIAGQVDEPDGVGKGLFLLDVALGPFGCFGLPLALLAGGALVAGVAHALVS